LSGTPAQRCVQRCSLVLLQSHAADAQLQHSSTQWHCRAAYMSERRSTVKDNLNLMPQALGWRSRTGRDSRRQSAAAAVVILASMEIPACCGIMAFHDRPAHVMHEMN
jgi:hypothetical protein